MAGFVVLSSIRGGALACVGVCRRDTPLQPCIRRAGGPDHDAPCASGARLRGGGTNLWLGATTKGAAAAHHLLGSRAELGRCCPCMGHSVSSGFHVPLRDE